MVLICRVSQDHITLFQEAHPSLDSYWRSVILFGRNVASYKFALAKSLLEIAPAGKTEITLTELAEPFSRHICEHLAHSPRQATSSSSQFLDKCKAHNDGAITREELLSVTEKTAFNYVIDAFHMVNNSELPIRFYEKDYARTKKIILTDEIFKLQDNAFFDNFVKETESRWRLVETAWEQNISAGLLDIQYTEVGDLLYIDTKKYRRKAVTSARAALNGYQKGKCFYCFGDISIGDEPDAGFDEQEVSPVASSLLLVSEKPPLYDRFADNLVGIDGKPLSDTPEILAEDSPAIDESDDDLCDVDHFIPHTLQRYIPEVNLDGVWNLVLTCKNCNRGGEGKFARVPATKYLDRLNKRNEFLINSHHPLRETLMRQTGATPEARADFLRQMDGFAVNHLIHRWETEALGEEVF